MQQVHTSNKPQSQKKTSQSFVSKYLLCCFSLKHKYPKSYIQPPSEQQRQRQKVPKIKPKAQKIFDINDQPTKLQTVPFRQIKLPEFTQTAPKAKSQFYAALNDEGTVTQRIDSNLLLDFRLDEDPGVSNTFAIPYFDYEGKIFQNRYFLSSLTPLRNHQ